MQTVLNGVVGVIFFEEQKREVSQWPVSGQLTTLLIGKQAFRVSVRLGMARVQVSNRICADIT